MKILLIEDSPSEAFVFQRRFEHDHEIILAKTASEAIKVLDDTIDVCVVDLIVPGAIGTSLIDTLTAMDRKLIVFTRVKDSRFIVKGEQGFDILDGKLNEMESEVLRSRPAPIDNNPNNKQ